MVTSRGGCTIWSGRSHQWWIENFRVMTVLTMSVLRWYSPIRVLLRLSQRLVLSQLSGRAEMLFLMRHWVKSLDHRKAAGPLNWRSNSSSIGNKLGDPCPSHYTQTLTAARMYVPISLIFSLVVQKSCNYHLLEALSFFVCLLVVHHDS